MRLLVTGGAGYIGSVVAAMLVNGGHEVTVLDDLSTGHDDAVPPGARLVKGSVDDVGTVLGEQPYDTVMHFAAKSLVAESVAHPDCYWHGNVGGALALLDAMRAHDVPPPTTPRSARWRARRRSRPWRRRSAAGRRARR